MIWYICFKINKVTMQLTLILSIITFAIFNSALAEDTAKQTLPSVQLKTLDEKTVNIQDYGKTGKTTILFFWETYCNPSIKGLDNILDVYEDWQKKYNCNLVGINMDDYRNRTKIKPLVNGKGWPYTFLIDENKDLSRALNISSCPYVLLLNQEGQIIYRHIGFAEGFETELEVQMKKLTK